MTRLSALSAFRLSMHGKCAKAKCQAQCHVECARCAKAKCKFAKPVC